MIPHLLNGFLSSHPEIEFINYHWVDLAGFLMARVVPVKRCIELATLSLPLTLGNHCLIGLASSASLTSAAASSGNDCLYPDWSTLRPLNPSNASVICNVSEEQATHPDVDPKNPYFRCPRSALQRAVRYGWEKFQVTFLAGFEIEFYLLDSDKVADRSELKQPRYRFHNGAWSLRDSYGNCVQNCVRQIESAGIVVETFHAVGGPRQFQITTGPLPVLESTDALVQTREIIRQTALDAGFRAIFLPKPFEGVDPSGSHAHLSINLANDCSHSLGKESNSIEDSFLAGILEKLPLISAIGMPNESSYKRVTPAAVGNWVAWGSGNRDTPVRRIKHNRWEFRAIDATSNMHLAMATYIASGLLGVQNQQELKIQDTTEPLAEIDEKILRQRGITTLMPRSFDEALNALKAPKYESGLSMILGPQILKFYTRVKELEVAYLARCSNAEIEDMYFDFY